MNPAWAVELFCLPLTYVSPHSRIKNTSTRILLKVLFNILNITLLNAKQIVWDEIEWSKEKCIHIDPD